MESLKGWVPGRLLLGCVALFACVGVVVAVVGCGGEPPREERQGPEDGGEPPDTHGNPDIPVNSSLFPKSGGDLVIQKMPSSSAFAKYFGKYTTVFGVYILASEKVADAKVMHATAVMAKYLDNDEDGKPDDPRVVAAMVKKRAALIMFQSSADMESSGFGESSLPGQFAGQDLQGEETNEPGRFDASLEEVLHLISSFGYAAVFPAVMGLQKGSKLADAMDKARGGYFSGIPASYPSSAWYTYGDKSCNYQCQLTEYFYWAMTSLLGAQKDRCSEISNEWKLCTPEQLKSGDLAISAILTDRTYLLPTRLPDGKYRGN